jgi:hypothetical protein
MNTKHRLAVFNAVVSVLRDEEAHWAAARNANPDLEKRFEYCFGVRAAPETAIAYLTWRRLLCENLVSGYIKPEHPVRGGRMDLWIGEQRGTPGLGIEFKFLMSAKEAGTVPPQATRLCGAADVNAAAFIMWGHDRDERERHVEPDHFEWPKPAGWNPWRCLAHDAFPAMYKKQALCRVWLFGTDRAG